MLCKDMVINMSLIIDLIIILAAVAAIYLGISRGFIRSVMHFASLILALVAVFLFTSPVAAWLNNSFIESGVSDIIEDSLSGIVSAGENSLDISKIFSDRPEPLNEIAAKFGCDLDELEAYYNNFLSSGTESEALGDLSGKIAAPTSQAISNVLAAIIVFIAAMLILRLITFILDMVFRLPVLDKLNKFLGLLFGIGSAVITSWVIANISVGLISAFESVNGEIFNQSVIDGSIILRFLYNNSLILF